MMMMMMVMMRREDPVIQAVKPIERAHFMHKTMMMMMMTEC